MMLSINHLDSRKIASTHTPFDNLFGWVQDLVAEEFECAIDDVNFVEVEDEGDLITVRGEPVARVVKS